MGATALGVAWARSQETTSEGAAALMERYCRPSSEAAANLRTVFVKGEPSC